MRAVLPTFALALSLSACAMPYSSPGTYKSGRYDAHMQPLRARIMPHGNMAVQLNRPAYVAVFEILPGRGVGLVYPTAGRRDGYMSSGYVSLWRPTNFYQASYLPDVSGYTAQGPRYFFLIASDEPLRVNQFVRSPMALRSALGFQRFASWNPYSLIDDLAQMVVPPTVDDDSWTTDVYVHWPEPRSRRDSRGQLVAVRCGDGRIFYVPLAYLHQGPDLCPTAVTRGDTTRADTTATRTAPERLHMKPRRADAEENQERRIRPGAERPWIEREARTGRRDDEPRRVEPRPEVQRPERAEPRTEGRNPDRPVRVERPERAEPRPEPQRAEPRPERNSEPRPEPARPARPEPAAERPPQ